MTRSFKRDSLHVHVISARSFTQLVWANHDLYPSPAHLAPNSVASYIYPAIPDGISDSPGRADNFSVVQNRPDKKKEDQ